MKRQLTSANFNFAITAALLICCLSNGCSQNHNQHEALISNDHLTDEQRALRQFGIPFEDLTGEQWLYLQENGGTLDSVFSLLDETIETETQKLQLSQQMIRQEQKRIAYLQQQMNNPEYMRNSYLARRLKELGIEDPTGNNWEEIITEDGSENTWAQATRTVHAQAMDGEFGLFKDHAVLKAFEIAQRMSPTGACCINGECHLMTSDYCRTARGEWLGAHTDCTDDSCYGACCIDGSCSITAENDCSGDWQGVGTRCFSGTCP